WTILFGLPASWSTSRARRGLRGRCGDFQKFDTYYLLELTRGFGNWVNLPFPSTHDAALDVKNWLPKGEKFVGMTHHPAAGRNSDAVERRLLKREGAPERLPILALFMHANIQRHKAKGGYHGGLVVHEAAPAELHGSG